MVFFDHLLIKEDPDCHQKLISCSFYHSKLLHKVLAQSIHNFLSNVAYGQPDKQKNKQTNTTENIAALQTKEVTKEGTVILKKIIASTECSISTSNLLCWRITI